MDNVNRLGRFLGIAVPGTVVTGLFIAPAAKVQWDIDHQSPAAMSQESVNLLLGMGLGVFVLSMLTAWAVSRR